MDVLCKWFTMREKFTFQERFQIMRTMFGGHTDEYDYHYVGLYSDLLNSLLIGAGFQEVQTVEHLAIFEDASVLCL